MYLPKDAASGDNLWGSRDNVVPRTPLCRVVGQAVKVHELRMQMHHHRRLVGCRMLDRSTKVSAVEDDVDRLLRKFSQAGLKHEQSRIGAGDSLIRRFV